MKLDRTSSVIRTIVLDALTGEPEALAGLIHWLVYDKGYSRKRLLRFACVTLKMPYHFVGNTLTEVVG